MKRLTALLLAMILGAFSGKAAAEKIITLSFAGDCTLGTEERTREAPDSFDSVARKEGYSYFFENFRDLFSRDDCTVVNCEGVLLDSAGGDQAQGSQHYRGPEEFVSIFREGSVEAVSLANNHAKDYGANGLENTIRVLEEAGIGWARGESFFVFEKDGIRIAFAALDYGIFYRSNYLLKENLMKMKENGEINAAVILIHEGKEFYPKHLERQEEFCDYFISTAVADLAIMHSAQVVQGIRIRNNRSAFYSLGNFVSGASVKVAKGERGTDSRYGLVVQARLHFSDDGVYKGQQMILYPVYTSGTDPENNYQPTRITAEQAIPVVEAIQLDTKWELPRAFDDETGLACVILDYLPANDNPPEETQPEEGKPEAAPDQPDRNR